MADELTRTNGSIERPVPFRLRVGAVAVPTGWAPDVQPNEIITASHINHIRTEGYAWPGDVDGQNHTLSNVHLVNATGVMVDPTTAAGDMIVRSDQPSPVKLPVGTQGQVLMVDTAAAGKVRWATPVPVVAKVFNRTGDVVAMPGDYTAAQVTNAVSTLGSYADPSWITSLAWSKVAASAPATFPPSAHTHAAGDITSGVLNTARLGTGIADASVYLRGDGVWAAAGGGAGGSGVASFKGRTGAVEPQLGDYTAAMVFGAVVDPTVAMGDLLVRSTTKVDRLPLGANGQILTADNAVPGGIRWGTAPGGPGLPGGLTNGDLAQWKSGAWQILGVGTTGQVLMVDTAGNGLRWGVGGGGSQTPWLTDVDAANHALNNTSTIVSNGPIKSNAGGFMFPDGSTQVSAAGQSPWNVDIDANRHTLSNVGRAPLAGLGAIGAALQLGIVDGGNGINLETQTWRVTAGSGHGAIEYRIQRRVDATLQCYLAWGTNYLLMGSPQAAAMRIDGAVGSAFFYQNVEVGVNRNFAGNLHYDGVDYRHIGNGSGLLMQAEVGQSAFYTVPIGTAGAVASPLQRVLFGDNGTTTLKGRVQVDAPGDSILDVTTSGSLQSSLLRLVARGADEWNVVAAGSALSGTPALRIVHGSFAGTAAFEIADAGSTFKSSAISRVIAETLSSSGFGQFHVKSPTRQYSMSLAGTSVGAPLADTFFIHDETAGASRFLIGASGHVVLSTPISPPSGSLLPNASISWYLDEAANHLNALVRYSNGTNKYAVINLI